jgi:hypothetical protein
MARLDIGEAPALISLVLTRIGFNPQAFMPRDKIGRRTIADANTKRAADLCHELWQGTEVSFIARVHQAAANAFGAGRPVAAGRTVQMQHGVRLAGYSGGQVRSGDDSCGHHHRT